ncbi:hypothetical protein [Paremcibacter congregatus]|uniref:YkvI family membrane protein n=1 Tax=Paremcibacter congregatus TaxID=2043170 RepID=UPI003A8FC1D7
MYQFYQSYILPGLIFQGVVIGGGYATGRELAEFFLPHGPVNGLLAMGIAALFWSAVMAVSFELCRLWKTYDYQSFFSRLLGRAGFLYEVLLVLLMIVVLAVVGAAAGEIAGELLGVSALEGTIGLLVIVGGLTFYGSHLVETFMGGWSILLYLSFLTLVVLCFLSFGDDIRAAYGHAAPEGSGWFVDGIRYAGYNLANVPAVFFCLTHITKRREALGAGVIGGLIAMSPAVFLFIAMVGQYPHIADAPIPSLVLLEAVNLSWFSVLFQIVLLGTLVQTGVGMVHAVNERIATSLQTRGREMPHLARSAVAIGLLAIALGLSNGFGIVALISNGYGLLTYGFIAVFVIPVLTIGLYRLWRIAESPEPPVV